MKLTQGLNKLAQAAKTASREVEGLTSQKKNQILSDVARELIRARSAIMAANEKDMRYADTEGLSSAMKDRLFLDEKRIGAMASAVEDVARLPDPVGQVIKKWSRPNGLKLEQVRVPLGVILVIFEARPNVTSECASLCLKSGNAVILRGGREAFYSNQAISRVYQKVLKRHNVSAAAVSFVDNTDRRSVGALLQLRDLIDLGIPRGGSSLIRHVTAVSKIPLVKHDQGICHVYVDKDADLKIAERIAINAKCQRPSVCNAMETLLVHQRVAKKFLPGLLRKLDELRCEVRLCSKTLAVLKVKGYRKATLKDWATEYLGLTLSVRTVSDLEEAIRHINRYGSRHTDSIVTRNRAAAEAFIKRVDSSSVMVNASTRFSDGNEYGFGAEIGISTDKIHARGPMGLEGLTTYKYVVRGTGQIRG